MWEQPSQMSGMFVYGGAAALGFFVLANFMAMAIIHFHLWEPKKRSKRKDK